MLQLEAEYYVLIASLGSPARCYQPNEFFTPNKKCRLTARQSYLTKTAELTNRWAQHDYSSGKALYQR